MRKRNLLMAFVAIIAVIAAALGSASTATAKPVNAKKADTFWCTVGGTHTVVNRTTFGSQGWVQLIGVKPNGNRTIYVYHPSGRNDTFRIRLQDSAGRELVLGPVTQSYHCSGLNAGERGRAEARVGGTGGAYDFGQWRQG